MKSIMYCKYGEYACKILAIVKWAQHYVCTSSSLCSGLPGLLVLEQGCHASFFSLPSSMDALWRA